MGLDNIPAEYPCRVADTAVMKPHPYIHDENDEDREMIDCRATQAAGGCPWLRDSIEKGMPVTGMFGTDCWYRGKSGMWMLEELVHAGYSLHLMNEYSELDLNNGFYGPWVNEGDDSERRTRLPAGYCLALGMWMENHAEAYAQLHKNDDDGGKEAIEEYRYAAWWLGWVARKADGATAWW